MSSQFQYPGRDLSRNLNAPDRSFNALDFTWQFASLLRREPHTTLPRYTVVLSFLYPIATQSSQAKTAHPT